MIATCNINHLGIGGRQRHSEKLHALRETMRSCDVMLTQELHVPGAVAEDVTFRHLDATQTHYSMPNAGDDSNKGGIAITISDHARRRIEEEGGNIQVETIIPGIAMSMEWQEKRGRRGHPHPLDYQLVLGQHQPTKKRSRQITRVNHWVSKKQEREETMGRSVWVTIGGDRNLVTKEEERTGIGRDRDDVYGNTVEWQALQGDTGTWECIPEEHTFQRAGKTKRNETFLIQTTLDVFLTNRGHSQGRGHYRPEAQGTGRFGPSDHRPVVLQVRRIKGERQTRRDNKEDQHKPLPTWLAKDEAFQAKTRENYVEEFSGDEKGPGAPQQIR